MENKKGISVFQRYLTVWVLLCMAAVVLIGKYLPGIPDFLGRFEYANVSIPMAALIWLMIYPMMMKVDFQSIRNVGRSPGGLFVTWVTNWLIKPFSMFGEGTIIGRCPGEMLQKAEGKHDHQYRTEDRYTCFLR